MSFFWKTKTRGTAKLIIIFATSIFITGDEYLKKEEYIYKASQVSKHVLFSITRPKIFDKNNNFGANWYIINTRIIKLIEDKV